MNIVDYQTLHGHPPLLRIHLSYPSSDTLNVKIIRTRREIFERASVKMENVRFLVPVCVSDSVKSNWKVSGYIGKLPRHASRCSEADQLKARAQPPPSLGIRSLFGLPLPQRCHLDYPFRKKTLENPPFSPSIQPSPRDSPRLVLAPPVARVRRQHRTLSLQHTGRPTWILFSPISSDSPLSIIGQRSAVAG